ncbi:uncharacterized protein RCO7_05109 [Rhynchosporium graminicola]|uniref:Uncharacterized protein n=1 Tax=Rhynchosporium graminicola TaxID=2792576 RepID=A0A1E1L6J9_9HELO|nr:uncharacterized protein RCO7_05109 [Rhynchosporium commune]
MDDNNRRRRPNEPHGGSDPRFNADQSHGRGFPGASAERYRPVPLSTSPSTGRGTAGASAYSGYYSETAPSFTAPLASNPLQYQSGYAPDQRQQQTFNGYAPNISDMYGVGQQTTQGTVYDTASQFQSRQPAAMQMLSDVPPSNGYFPSEQNNTPGPPSLQHHASSGSPAVYSQNHSPADRSVPLLQPGYPTSMGMGAMNQSAPDLMDEDFQEGPGMEQAYTAYQTALKQIFQNIINGRLSEAATSLLEVSEWLLQHVGDLGLTVDEVALHSDRIRLWGEFNTAWLSIFQKQKDMLEAGQHLHLQHGQSLMTQNFINKMAKDLIRMGDAVEKHGLVDYQYGVAEEQIMMILTDCLDFQETIENPGIGRAHP